MTPTQIHITLG